MVKVTKERRMLPGHFAPAAERDRLWEVAACDGGLPTAGTWARSPPVGLSVAPGPADAVEETEAVCIHCEFSGGEIVPGQLLAELRDRSEAEKEFCAKMDEGVLRHEFRSFDDSETESTCAGSEAYEESALSSE